MVGEAYDYEPWLRDGKIEVCGHLPTLSRPRMSMIHERMTSLGYIVDGFGQYSDEVIAHYRRVAQHSRIIERRVLSYTGIIMLMARGDNIHGIS